MAVPVTPSPYATPTTSDPLPGLTRLMDSFTDAMQTLLIGLLAFIVAAICLWLWRSIEPELLGTAVLGVVGLGAVIFGFVEIAKAYSIVDGATGGLLGKLFGALVAFAPLLLVVGAFWLLTKWVDRY